MASDRYSMSLTDDTGEDARRFTPEHAYDAQPRTTLTFEVDGEPVLTFRSAESLEMRAPGPTALDEMLRKANAYDDLAALRDAVAAYFDNPMYVTVNPVLAALEACREPGAEGTGSDG